jgi:hypothetical protein
MYYSVAHLSSNIAKMYRRENIFKVSKAQNYMLGHTKKRRMGVGAYYQKGE